MPFPSCDPVLTCAFRAGWNVAQLHGPLLARQSEPAAILPTVGEMGRGDSIDLAIAEVRRALEGDLASCLVARDGEAALAVEELEALVALEDLAGVPEAVERLHLPLLMRLTVAGDRIGAAYSTGRALSDTCWRAHDSESFRAQFNRYRLATIQGWLSQLSPGLPAGAAGAVSQSLDHWAAWAEVHSDLDWTVHGEAVLDAARAQGDHWRGLLVGDLDPSSLLTPAAYVEAGEAALRRSHIVVGKIVRRAWPILALVAGLVVVLAVLALVFAHGTAKVWGAAISVVSGLGITGAGVWSAAGRLAAEAGKPVLNLASSDAMGWSCTWLPVVPTTEHQARQLRERGVAPVSGPGTAAATGTPGGRTADPGGGHATSPGERQTTALADFPDAPGLPATTDATATTDIPAADVGPGLTAAADPADQAAEPDAGEGPEPTGRMGSAAAGSQPGISAQSRGGSPGPGGGGAPVGPIAPPAPSGLVVPPAPPPPVRDRERHPGEPPAPV